MPTSPVIVHLIGYPGAGKYTVARAIARLSENDGRRYVVVDNHHTSNVIFAVLDIDGVRSLPEEVWDIVGDVRAALYRAIAELSPPEWSFVFTNVLTRDKPIDAAIVERVSALAAQRGNHYVPVFIECARDELLRRVPASDRGERMKWIDPAAVDAFMNEHELIDITPHDPLHVDVTELSPDGAARRILDHIASLG